MEEGRRAASQCVANQKMPRERRRDAQQTTERWAFLPCPWRWNGGYVLPSQHAALRMQLWFFRMAFWLKRARRVNPCSNRRPSPPAPEPLTPESGCSSSTASCTLHAARCTLHTASLLRAAARRTSPEACLAAAITQFDEKGRKPAAIQHGAPARDPLFFGPQYPWPIRFPFLRNSSPHG